MPTLRKCLAKLAAGSADVIAAGAADVGDDAAGAEDLAEGADLGGRWRPVNRAAEAGADGVVGNEIHVGAKTVQQIDQGVGLFIRIVYTFQEAVFDVDDAAGAILELF